MSIGDKGCYNPDVPAFFTVTRSCGVLESNHFYLDIKKDVDYHSY